MFLRLYFHYFVIISLWKKEGPSFKKLEFPSFKDYLCLVWLKLAQWFYRRRFFLIRQCFFRNDFPLEKGGVLHLYKTLVPSPKDALCQVWLTLALWFWRRRSLNTNYVFLPFPLYLPLEKGVALHLIKHESLLPVDALCQICLKLAQCF